MVSVGSYSGFSNTTGTLNTFIGTSAGRNNNTGSNNTMLGINSGQFSNGNNNTFLGASSGTANLLGSSNVAIGYNAQTGAAFSNAIAIGANASVTQSNSMSLGGTGANAVNVGIGTTAPQAELEVNGYTMLGSSAPKIQMKKLSGTTSATQGTFVNIAHGLAVSKIIAIDVLVEYSSNSFIHHSYQFNPGFEFNYFINATNITIANVAANSGSILSKPFKILITYEQ